MNAKKNVLGRGLNALMVDAVSRKEPEGTRLIPINRIEINPYQPRKSFNEDALKELSESIARLGIIQPITVRKIGEEKYQLISGERRLRASKMAGLVEVPAFIRDSEDNEMLELALVENIQREDLDAIEVALSDQQLIEECSLTQEELADRVGKKRATVTNYLRLLKLPPEIQLGIRKNIISMGHARTLVNIEDTETQIMLYEQIIKYDFSVRKIEEIVRNLSHEEPNKEKGKRLKMPSQTEARKRITASLGCRVSISADDTGKGKISLSFKSEEDYILLVEKLIKNRES